MHCLDSVFTQQSLAVLGLFLSSTFHILYFAFQNVGCKLLLVNDLNQLEGFRYPPLEQEVLGSLIREDKEKPNQLQQQDCKRKSKNDLPERGASDIIHDLLEAVVEEEGYGDSESQEELCKGAQ